MKTAAPASTGFERVLVVYGTALGGLALIVFFALAAPRFFDIANALNILKHVSFTALLGLGFALALTVGELDLSFAQVCSLGSVVCGFLVHHGHPIPLAIGAGLGIGVAFGIVNGLLVTALKIPSLVATLATGSVALGLSFMISQGVSIVGRWSPDFLWLGRGEILGVPVLVWWMAAGTALALFLLKQTRLGLRMISVGEADEAARLAGIGVRRMKVWGLAFSGLAAGAVAVLLTANLSSTSATTAGDYLLTAIAAVLLGMTTIEPGRPNVWGTLVGAVIIGVLRNGLTLLDAPYYTQDIVLGIIMIGAVAVSSSTLKKAAFNV
jgi:ribose transport system permease protein